MDAAQALADLVSSRVPGLRAWAFMPDSFVPDGFVVGQPEMDYTRSQGFCTTTMTLPCYVVVSRNRDQAAQEALLDYVEQVEEQIQKDPNLGGACDVAQVQDARPQAVAVSGQEFPGYVVSIQVLV